MSSVFAAAAGLRVFPEIALGVGAIAPLVWGRVVPGRARAQGALALAIFALLTASMLALGDALRTAPEAPALPPPEAARVFAALASDGPACVVRVMFPWLAAWMLATQLPSSSALPRALRVAPRQASLVCLATLGAGVLAMATTFTDAWLAAELVAIASVGLVAVGAGDRRAASAALKLAVISGVASGVILYGAAILYGASGSLAFHAIGDKVVALTNEQGQTPEAVYIGGLFVVVGFLSKAGILPSHGAFRNAFGVAPFHATAFLAVVPGAATTLLFVRFFHDALRADGPDPIHAHCPWPLTLGFLALGTALAAGASAIREPSLPRVLGLLGLASNGLALLAASTFTAEGNDAALLQVVASGFAATAAFAVAATALEPGKGRDLASLPGLGRRSPFVATVLAVALASLAAVPPFPGSVARLRIVVALLDAKGPFDDAHVIFALGIGATTLLGVFATIRILGILFVASDRVPPPFAVRRTHAWAIFALVAPVIVAAFASGTVLDALAKVTLAH